MPFLTLKHRANYRYREPVVLGEHRMMFRPRESHDLRLISSSLQISPRPTNLRWLHDTFDNSVAIAAFEDTATELKFESMVTLERFDSTQPEYPLEDYARTYPFRYTDEDFPNLERAVSPSYDGAEVSQWALRFLDNSNTTPTMKLLMNLTRGIREELAYIHRHEKGVQSPAETLQCQQGSCRDLAVLMIEAARSLGIAARFVSGYVFTPGDANTSDRGSTHAWMQAYLPGAGWIDFDPTNRIIGNRNLISVAVAWSPKHVMPLSGTFSGPLNSCISMEVDVDVAEVAQQSEL